MPRTLKGLVSKRKRRFQEDGFDLDLSYISDRIIAMGFPAEKLEGVYRNHIDDVARFLQTRHRNHYKIFHLCDERDFNVCRFSGPVAKYPFHDHNAPQFEQMIALCEDVRQFLARDPKNIVAINCKAGKGRTGVMVCACLLHMRLADHAVDALRFYGERRTEDGKGVTIPSQRRYVHYYDAYLSRNVPYSRIPLRLNKIRIKGINGQPGAILDLKFRSYLNSSETFSVVKSGNSCSLNPSATAHLGEPSDNLSVDLIQNGPMDASRCYGSLSSSLQDTRSPPFSNRLDPAYPTPLERSQSWGKVRSPSPATHVMPPDPLITLGTLSSAPIQDDQVVIPVSNENLPTLSGDVCVKVSLRHHMLSVKLCRLWFNTFFVAQQDSMCVNGPVTVHTKPEATTQSSPSSYVPAMAVPTIIDPHTTRSSQQQQQQQRETHAPTFNSHKSTSNVHSPISDFTSTTPSNVVDAWAQRANSPSRRPKDLQIPTTHSNSSGSDGHRRNANKALMPTNSSLSSVRSQSSTSESNTVSIEATDVCVHGVPQRHFTYKLDRSELDNVNKNKFRHLLSRGFTITFSFTSTDCHQCSEPTHIRSHLVSSLRGMKGTGHTHVQTTASKHGDTVQVLVQNEDSSHAHNKATSPSRSGLTTFVVPFNLPVSLPFTHSLSFRSSSQNKVTKPQQDTVFQRNMTLPVPKRNASTTGSAIAKAITNTGQLQSVNSVTAKPVPSLIHDMASLTNLTPSSNTILNKATTTYVGDEDDEDEEDEEEEEEEEEYDDDDDDEIDQNQGAELGISGSGTTLSSMSDPLAPSSHVVLPTPFANCLIPATCSLSLNAIDNRQPSVENKSDTAPTLESVAKSRSLVHFSRLPSVAGSRKTSVPHDTSHALIGASDAVVQQRVVIRPSSPGSLRLAQAPIRNPYVDSPTIIHHFSKQPQLISPAKFPVECSTSESSDNCATTTRL